MSASIAVLAVIGILAILRLLYVCERENDDPRGAWGR